MYTDKFIMFGNVQAWIRAVNGRGAIGSFILESKVRDEIDYEWIGGEKNSVQSITFGRGNNIAYGSKTSSVPNVQEGVGLSLRRLTGCVANNS